MAKTKGPTELIIDKSAIKAGKYLSQDIDYLWSVLSGQTDPAVKYAVLELENTNLNKEREIQKLKNDLVTAKKRVHISPTYISGTYFFNEQGPYCTTCYDKKEKKVHMIPKVFDVYNNIKFMILTMILFGFAYIGVSVFKNTLNETFLFILQIFILILMVLASYYIFNIFEMKIKEFYKKRSDYTDYKCGVCKNTVKVNSRSIKRYQKEVIEKNKEENKEKNIEKLTPIYLTRIREISRHINSRVLIPDEKEINVETYEKIFKDIQKFNNDLIENIDKFSDDRHKILNSKTENT